MITSASYQAKYEQVGDEAFRVLVRLIDDVRGPLDQWFIASGATAVEIRDDLSRQIAALNTRRSLKSVLDGIASGTNVPVTAPAPPTEPAPTAAQLWAVKARRLARVRAMGTLTGTLATAADALQADVTATYQAGFLGEL